MYHSGYEPAHYYVQLFESNFADENAAIILQISGEWENIEKELLAFYEIFPNFLKRWKRLPSIAAYFWIMLRLQI